MSRASVSTAYNHSLNLLGLRPYTTKDLRRKLVQKGFDPSDIDRAVEKLLGNGLLDDERFAMQFARGRLLAKGASKRNIQQTLARKGIPAEMANAAIDRVIEDEEFDAEAALDRVARKKLASLGDLEPIVLRRRLYAFLARRGYDLDEIRRAVGRLTRERSD